MCLSGFECLEEPVPFRSTLPIHRRRGVSTSLINITPMRLSIAVAVSCRHPAMPSGNGNLCVGTRGFVQGSVRSKKTAVTESASARNKSDAGAPLYITKYLTSGRKCCEMRSEIQEAHGAWNR